MKKPSLIFLFWMGILKIIIGQTPLEITKTNTPQSEAIDYSFDEIVPNLKLLTNKNKTPFEIDEIKVVQFQNPLTTIIMGRILTTSIIKEKIGKHHFADKNKTWSEPTLKNIEIHADSLILDGDVNLPECNLYIHARIIKTNKYKLNTSPVPFDKTLSLNKNHKGREGRKAGNIMITAYEILPSNKPFYLTAKGSNGDNKLLPKVSINLPNTAGTHEVYKKHGCKEQGNYSTKTTFPEYCVAVYFDNAGDCDYYKSYDKKITFKNKDKLNSTILDNDTLRLEYTIYPPGHGGKGGDINVNTQEKFEYLFTDFSGGYSGQYVSGRKSDRFGELHTVYDPKPGPHSNEYIKTGQNEYELYRYRVDGMISIDAYKKELIQKLKIPSDESLKKLNDKIRNSWPQEGKPGIKTIRTLNYLPSEIYVNKILSNRYKNFDRLDNQSRKRIESEHNFLLFNTTKPISESLSLKEESDALSIMNNIIEMLNSFQLDVDEFGNGPGYRPMLSMTSILSYMDKKGDIEEDIKTYVLADLASKGEIEKGKFIQKIPNRIIGLKNQLEGLKKELHKLALDSAKIVLQAEEVLKETKEIEVEFEKLEKLIEKSSKQEKLIHNGSISLLKAGAVAASTIPYGQPALQAVVGNGLLALSEEIKIDGNGNAKEIGMRVMSKIDYASVISDLRNEFELTELNWTKRNQPKNKAKLLELTRQAQENAKKAQVAASKKKEKNFENYKKEYVKQSGYLTKGVQKAQDIFKTYANASLSSKENDVFFTRLASRHILYQSLVKKLKNQNEKKEKLYDDLNVIIAKTKALNKKFIEIPKIIIELNELYANQDDYYCTDLENLYHTIAENSLKRINWAEYQLKKAYEYTTLQPFDHQSSSSQGFLREYQRYLIENKDNGNPIKIDQLLDHMAIYMKSLPKSIGQKMLKEVKNNKKEDKRGEEVRITSLAEGNEVFVNPKVNELNDPNHYYSTSVDLQQDLIQSIISPGKDAVRIKNIELDEIKFDKPIKGKVEFSIEVGEEGILKNGPEFYFFNTEEEDKYSMRWSWSINDKGEIYNESQISSELIALTNLLTNQNSNQADANGILFALPPAWSKLKLKIRHYGSLLNEEKIPKVVDLRFRIVTTYKDAPKNSVKTLDVRQKNNLNMSSVHVNIDTKKYTLSKGLYTTFSPGATITLSVPQNNVHCFERWEVYGDIIDKDMLTKNTIRLKAFEDLRIIAIFKDELPDLNLIASEDPLIDVYSSPTSGEQAIIRVKPDEIIKLEDDVDDGFQKVLIGIEEGYITQIKH